MAIPAGLGSPAEWALRGSNPGPTDYEDVPGSAPLRTSRHHSARLALNVGTSRAE
jgi:hypothetical protein